MSHRYLDARVGVASQPELQLLLLDGALRFSRQALALAATDADQDEYDRLLGRALAIAEQLVASVSGRNNEQARRLEEEYAFLYRQLVASKVARGSQPLSAAIRLTEYHRETWRLACEKIRSESVAQRSVPAPTLSSAQMPAAGFSVQA
jgi:flagellar biosynthetic protein FliS